MMNILEVRRHVAGCQKCFTHGPECSTVEIAQQSARARGWLEIQDRTLCSDCRREVEEERRKRNGLGVGGKGINNV